MNELRILNGLSRGAAFPFDEEKISLGSSLDADIFISDPGIYEKHAIFSENPQGEGYSFKILDKDASSSSDQALSLGTPVAISGVWVALVDESAPWDMRLPESLPIDNKFVKSEEKESIKKNRPKQRIPIIPIILISIFCTLSFKMFASANIVDVDPSSDAEMGDELISTTGIDQGASVHGNNVGQSLIEKFKRMLAERELKNLTLDDNPKKWTISGNISELSKHKLHRTIERFKSENSFSFVIHDSTSIISKTLPFKLIRIVSGPYGHVITDKGKRLSVGGTIDGYTLKSVGKKKIVFQGQNTIELVW